MCGIAGAIGLSADAGRAAVARMIAAIRHRGPDDQGDFAADGIAFGMCRLSIIDLAQGHQPMWGAGGAGIVFNGEIYNYRALRSELEAGGAVFRTQSDTEVVLRLYEQRSLDALDRLDGMFALCLYDAARRRLHLVRDRLGKKPLYYAELGGVFYYASEAKAIIAALDDRPGIDAQALHHYLTLRYVPGPATVWRGIKKLPPGTALTLDLDRREAPTLARYWSLAFKSETADPGRDYVGEFETLFLGAVEKRLVAADVPVGVLLSGGLDSSAVAAASVELGHRAFHTFSVAFAEGGEADETPFARQVAARLGTRHDEIVIGQREFLDFLPDLVRCSDEPLADLASVPLFFVSRLARKAVKVVLSGEGADEMLAGYDLEQTARTIDRMRLLLRIVPRSVLAQAARLLPTRMRDVLTDVTRVGVEGLFPARATHMTRVWSEAEKRALWRNAAVMESTDDLIRSWYEAARSPEPIDQLQQVNAGSWLVEDLLMKADKMSMANSLELRCPFLDHGLAEWCARLPLAWKVGSHETGYRSKRILRAFARSRLPEAIIERPKRGFPVPAYRWLEGPLGAWAEDRLISGRRLDRFFDLRTARRTLDLARRGDEAAQHKVWNLLILDHWLEAWACG
ncbi:MAG TPA: asparagine synthase (glutamine-hydrolyzing) [Stellaceae bacterium]|nr:asparagine synthase (glutamine-hydrolyzing) [Stellaceae bacterium]